MQPSYERNYRDLLTRMIPRHLLSSQRVEGIQTALAGGDRLEIVRQAYLSLEELTAKGVYRKHGLGRSATHVSATYALTTGRSSVTLEMTRPEWEEVSGVERRPGGLVPSILAGIISSLSLNDSPKRVNEKIQEMLALSPHIHRGAEGFLLLLQDLPYVAAADDERIRVSTAAAISSNGFYRGAFGRGATYRFVQEKSASIGEGLFALDPPARSAILIPLADAAIRWGVLEIHLEEDALPAAEVIDNFSLLGRGIMRLLENNRRLETMVSIDRLTQVNNRNYYESQLPLEMERATRNKTCLTFLMLDIDDFKSINDRCGHDVGDGVLKLIAQTVRKHLRRIDLLFRYGGEEFIALLPGVGREDSERTADRIRLVVSRLRHVPERGGEVRPTVSIGGCIYPLDAQNETELFRRADQALYVSKKEGKNRVTFYRAEE